MRENDTYIFWSGLTENNINDIRYYISTLRENDEFDSLYNVLRSLGSLILLGGAIRDIAISKKRPRDLDFIIDTEHVELDIFVKDFNYDKNSFGGYKVKFQDIAVDFWSIKSHWAFKEGILASSHENIAKSCFYNIDSIYLNLATSDWHGYLFETLNSKILDIVLADDYIDLNPTKDLNVLRAFQLKEKYHLQFSPKLHKYIYNWFKNTEDPARNLSAIQAKHYGSESPWMINEIFESWQQAV